VRNDRDARVSVLYRTGAQSRSFEEVLRRLGIRYRVVGGFSFYERAEVRNALAYVRLLFHPEDDVALLRVLNVPPRGIGAVTISMLEARAKETNQSLWGVIRSGEFLTGKKIQWGVELLPPAYGDLQAECAEMRPRSSSSACSNKRDTSIGSSNRTTWSILPARKTCASLPTQWPKPPPGQTLEDVLDRAALIADSDEYDERFPYHS